MKKTNFYHPKFIPTWILIALMKLGAKLPFAAQVFIGRIMGDFLYLILTRFRKIALINIERCFTDKNSSQIKHLARQHFRAIGISIFETANAYFATDDKIQQNISIHNAHHLNNALEEKQGIILLAAHFMPLMLGGRILLLKHPIANIYRPQNNALFNKIMCENLTKHGALMVKAKNMRAIIKSIKSGLPIWYAPDQDLGEKNSVFAPFFNIQTATLTITARLAKIPNTVVIPYSFVRTENGWRMDFDAPLSDYPTNNALKDATTTNQILQTQILKTPEQYLWIHRRFKTRPKNEKSFY